MEDQAELALKEVFEPLVMQMEKRVAKNCTRSPSDIDDVIQQASIKFARGVDRNARGSFTNPPSIDTEPYQRFAWLCLEQSQLDFGRRQGRKAREPHREECLSCKNEPIASTTDGRGEELEAFEAAISSLSSTDARIIECIRRCRIEVEAARELGITSVQLTRAKQRIVAKLRQLLSPKGDFHAI